MRRLDSVTVLMDAPHDPHNGAAVLRSCDAFGVQRLHIVERTESFPRGDLGRARLRTMGSTCTPTESRGRPSITSKRLDSSSSRQRLEASSCRKIWLD